MLRGEGDAGRQQFVMKILFKSSYDTNRPFLLYLGTMNNQNERKYKNIAFYSSERERARDPSSARRFVGFRGVCPISNKDLKRIGLLAPFMLD